MMMYADLFTSCNVFHIDVNEYLSSFFLKPDFNLLLNFRKFRDTFLITFSYFSCQEALSQLQKVKDPSLRFIEFFGSGDGNHPDSRIYNELPEIKDFVLELIFDLIPVSDGFGDFSSELFVFHNHRVYLEERVFTRTGKTLYMDGTYLI